MRDIKSNQIDKKTFVNFIRQSRWFLLYLRIATLCRKEFLAILKDPRSRIILLAPVLLQSLIFGYAASYDLQRIPYAVLNQDRGAWSGQWLAQLDGTGLFIRQLNLENSTQIDAAINLKQVALVVHIPPDFERGLLAGQTMPIQTIVDSRNSNSAAAIVGYLNQVNQAFNMYWRTQQSTLAVSPLQIVERAWYNPNLETRWNMLTGLMAALAMLQTLMLTALSVAREREHATFDQLLVTPFTSGEILWGKALPSMVIGLIQASIIFLVAWGWFEIPFVGSLLTLYAGLSVFVLAIVGLGLSLSALAQNMQQAMLYAFVLMVPMMMLSGLMTPIRTMPKLIQLITQINPLRYGVDLTQRVYLEGANWVQIMPNVAILAAMAMVTLWMAAWLFRNRVG